MALSEQIYQDLTDQLPALTEAIQTGVEYGGDLATRFIQYDIAMQIIWIVVSSALSLVLYHASVKYGKGRPEIIESTDNFNKGEVRFFTAAFQYGLIALSVIAALKGAHHAQIIIKDIFIPEIRIMEVLADLMQGASLTQ